MNEDMKVDKKIIRDLQTQAADIHAKEPAYRRAAITDTIWMLLIAVLVALSINQFVFSIIRVQGPSMQPTFWTNERVFTEKISYLFSEPKRKDVVVARYVPGEEQVIKRVIGLPGETVEIYNGQIYIDGELLDETAYWNDIISYYGEMPPVTVPEDHIFIVGDNRNNSYDSREVGPIPMDQVVGHVSWILWPFSKIGGYPK